VGAKGQTSFHLVRENLNIGHLVLPSLVQNDYPNTGVLAGLAQEPGGEMVGDFVGQIDIGRLRAFLDTRD